MDWIVTILGMCFLDPVAAAVGFGLGVFARNWWHLLAAGIAAATAREIALSITQTGHQIWGMFVLGGVVAGTWWALGGRVMRMLADRLRPQS